MHPARPFPPARPPPVSRRFAASTLLSSRRLRCVALAAAVGLGSLVLVHPDPYSLTALTRRAKGAGLTGYPVHFTAYLALAGLAAALRPRGGRRANDSDFARRIDAAAWPVFLALHGVGTECLQAFVPSRTCDPLDAACNLAGAAVGWTAASLLAPASLPAAAPAVSEAG